MNYNSRPSNNQYPYTPSTRRITLKLEYIKPKKLFEQYYTFYSKPEDLGETKYIKKNKKKETIESLETSLKKLKSKLEKELFILALRYEAQNKKPLASIIVIKIK